jgi:hypothetical protein
MAAIVVVWLLAWSGYVIFQHSRMTAEKVNRYQRGLDLSRLSAAERLKALKALADKVNALSPEEREHWRMDLDWFQQLTEEEKAFFIDAFLPGEMKMALRMFERWPKEKQRDAIDDAMKELRNRAADPEGRALTDVKGTNGPLFSPQMDQKIRTMGLNTLYSQGSAQTRAELAPLLMEVQRQFESGQLKLSK